jgi:hypothetical protein
MIENVQKTNGKNGLIELFRFLFAIWVVYFHGWLGVDGELFADCQISLKGVLLVVSRQKRSILWDYQNQQKIY